MKCTNPNGHEFKIGLVIENKPTNGLTTDSSKWRKGEGLYASREYWKSHVDKCIHCGYSIRRGYDT
jgi:hypothetical protein